MSKLVPSSLKAHFVRVTKYIKSVLSTYLVQSFESLDLAIYRHIYYDTSEYINLIFY